ncbi:hypothetical protein GGR54DRAFT_359440 [Hypoxylon sp. NC1633]|nr:hypothetical protein GGR54DRAFT_359440 [Hypoxylon sp. NC1633]
MGDEQEQPASAAPKSNFHCPLCKKTFAQESTRKRHYYYCRTRQSSATTSRKRSCVACVRAKARCTWPADTSLNACNRCSKRGENCEYDMTVVRRHEMPDQGDPSPATNSLGLDGGQDLDFPTTSTLTQEVDRVDKLQVSPLAALFDCTWDLGAVWINRDRSVGRSDDSSLSYGSTTMAVLGCPPFPLQVSGSSIFTPRVFTRPDHRALSTLAFRLLRSYPCMVMQKGSLPPFLSPRVYACAETGDGPPSHALVNCVSSVQAFKSRSKEADKSWIWGRIWFEQERIMAEYSKYDEWELLASLQALLVYCLLRLEDTPAGHEAFDVSLLGTINHISSALAVVVEEHCDWDLPEEPLAAWRYWIFSESRRRTALLFQILNMLVDISSTISYRSVMGLVLVPLPSPAQMWNTLELETWLACSRASYEARTLYGLSEVGTLTRINKNNCSSFQTSVAEWEAWRAEVGDIGTLVMIISGLFQW